LSYNSRRVVLWKRKMSELLRRVGETTKHITVPGLAGGRGVVVTVTAPPSDNNRRTRRRSSFPFTASRSVRRTAASSKLKPK